MRSPLGGGELTLGVVETMKHSGPSARGETVREALRRALREGPATARDLSAAVGIRERDIAEHLAHLSRSLVHDGERLVVEPASCVACGYRFSDRSRLTRPGACPSCRSTRIEPPGFCICPRPTREHVHEAELPAERDLRPPDRRLPKDDEPSRQKHRR